jgi:thiamine biosynthesis lipoprotein ApbE
MNYWTQSGLFSACGNGQGNLSELQNVIDDQSELSQPGMAERAIDTATDVSRTITEVSAALHAAVDRLSSAIATARQPGQPLSTVSAITREAPLASLFVAFLFGVAVARRR